MSERLIQITHNGVTYSGELANIKSTVLGWASHGVLSAGLNCEWKSGGVQSGGYCLDMKKSENDYSRKGTAFGLDHIMRIMETVGVPTWEALTGKQVIVLFDGKGGWGSPSVGIAGTLNDKILIFKEHANLWRGSEGMALIWP